MTGLTAKFVAGGAEKGGTRGKSLHLKPLNRLIDDCDARNFDHAVGIIKPLYFDQRNGGEILAKHGPVDRAQRFLVVPISFEVG
jgi:hypothetical protein